MSHIQHLTLQGKAVRARVLAAAQPHPTLTMRAAFQAILFAGLLSLSTTAAHAGVTYDNGVKSGFQWGVTTITTAAFTIGSGANRAAMIMVTMSANNATNITASLGGVSGTLIPGTDSGTTAAIRTVAFQVVNPPSGSQTATVSWTTSMNADIGVITVSGADQTTPCTNGTFAAANSAPAQTTSVTIASNSGDLTASVGFSSNVWVAPYTNQTLEWGIDSNSTGGDIGPGTGTTTHTWTGQFSGENHAVTGANFKASGSSSSGGSGGSGGAALNACDLNADGVVNSSDAQLEANMILGSTPCTANIDGAGVCDAVVLQRVVNDAMGGTCVIGNSHTVSLTWTASSAPNVTGYNVYRASTSGGPYAKVNSSTVAGTTYTDNSVQSGQTYYYVATAMDNTSTESSYSNQGMAAVPNP